MSGRINLPPCVPGLLSELEQRVNSVSLRAPCSSGYSGVTFMTAIFYRNLFQIDFEFF